MFSVHVEHHVYTSTNVHHCMFTIKQDNIRIQNLGFRVKCIKGINITSNSCFNNGTRLTLLAFISKACELHANKMRSIVLIVSQCVCSGNSKSFYSDGGKISSAKTLHLALRLDLIETYPPNLSILRVCRSA